MIECSLTSTTMPTPPIITDYFRRLGLLETENAKLNRLVRASIELGSNSFVAPYYTTKLRRSYYLFYIIKTNNYFGFIQLSPAEPHNKI